mmetsp:Transcript_31910/g.69687  ORF Transcript_31910/g.69687 Transcript_31910/m.69687 type:complete len:235 (-) Transcript_31910:62-766(-)
MKASLLTSSKMSSDTRRSYITTSALCISCTERMVSRPGSPGPVPTRCTSPGPAVEEGRPFLFCFKSSRSSAREGAFSSTSSSSGPLRQLTASRVQLCFKVAHLFPPKSLILHRPPPSCLRAVQATSRPVVGRCGSCLRVLWCACVVRPSTLREVSHRREAAYRLLQDVDITLSIGQFPCRTLSVLPFDQRCCGARKSSKRHRIRLRFASLSNRTTGVPIEERLSLRAWFQINLQ